MSGLSRCSAGSQKLGAGSASAGAAPARRRSRSSPELSKPVMPGLEPGIQALPFVLLAVALDAGQPVQDETDHARHTREARICDRAWGSRGLRGVGGNSAVPIAQFQTLPF